MQGESVNLFFNQTRCYLLYARRVSYSLARVRHVYIANALSEQDRLAALFTYTFIN